MTAPTLLAMSDDQITNEALKYWLSWGGQDIVRFTRAIIAARDAQWAARHNTWVDGINKAMAAEVDRLQHMLSNADNEWAARLDQERHDAYVTGQRDGAQYVQERMKRETEVLRIERDDARRMRDAAMKHISDGVALQIPAVTLQGFTEQQVQARLDAAVRDERAGILQALRAELDHAAINDHRLTPDFGKRLGATAVRAANIEAVMDAIRARTKD